jgi:cell division protein FtsL
MKRWLPLINFILMVVLVVGTLIIHHQERSVIALQQQTIEVQRVAVEQWKARAMACDGLVLK